MKPVFLFLLLGISTQAYLLAQKISLHPDLFKNAHKSLLILSGDDGQVFKAEVFDSAAITDVYTLQAPPDDQGRKMHFTILNEYTFYIFDYTTVTGKTHMYNRAYTYYNIPDTMFITQIPEIVKYERKSLRTISILIDGVNSVESVTALSPHQTLKQRFDDNTHTLEISYRSEWDPCILLNCNGEQKTRWLQIQNPDDEGVLIEYETLPNDLETHSITLPEKEVWGISVKARFPDGYETVQNYEINKSVKQNEYAVLLPADVPLNQYRIQAGRPLDKMQSRALFYNWSLKDADQIPKVDLSDFKFKFESDSNSFVFKTDKVQHQIELYYFSRYSIYTSWVINGKYQREMKFKFPDISNEIKEQFLTPVDGKSYLPFHIRVVKEFENGNQVFVEGGIH